MSGSRQATGGSEPGNRTHQPSGRKASGGFTLIELLLVTVILGLLASMVAPYFGAARERAYAGQMRADLRHLMEGVETYILLNDGRFPATLEELIEGSTYNPSRGVEYCTFLPVPPGPARDGYAIATVAHPGTTIKLFMAYPLWGGRILEFDSGSRGC